jgi:RNA polymerase sigma-70 factor (ECF subfamily)
MKETSAQSADLELQQMLLERAEGLRQVVSKKIPARFRSLVAAEDVLQDVWISAFRTFSDFRQGEPAAFDHWLKAIVNRRLADAIRSAGALKRGGDQLLFHDDRTRARSWADLFSHVSGHEKTPSREMSSREATNALRIALGRLPEPQRRVVYMRHIEGRSREEIAKTMQKSDAAIGSLLRRGLHDLRQCLRHASRFFSDTRSSADQGLEADPPAGGTDL